MAVADLRRAERHDDRPVAIIDIGSNSVRLVVYDRVSRAPFPRFNEKSMCRLGGDLDSTGRLAEPAMDCTRRAIRRYADIAKAMGVQRIDVIATEALRRADNGDELIESIHRETGHTVRLLSGAEEARLAALGVVAGFHRPTGIVGDMGGGSLEFCGIAEGKISAEWASLPIGALRVARIMERHGRDAKKVVDDMLATSAWPPPSPETFYVVGGGWRAIARVHMAIEQSPITVTHGLDIDCRDARKLAKSIAYMNEDEVANLPGVPARRISTMQASALAFDRTLKRLKPERVVFSALGVREGWLYDRLPPQIQSEDPLLAGAREFGRTHSRVPLLGEAMADWTAGLFTTETERQQRLRIATCELCDLGWRDHPTVRGLECYRRLSQFPLVGLSHPDRVFIALAVFARYGGSGEDPALNPAISLLTPAQRQRALVLGRILRVGFRYSGGIPELLATARLVLAGDTLKLEVTESDEAPDADSVRERLRSLAKAMGVARTEIAGAA